MEIKDLTIDESLWGLKCPYEMDDVWGVCVHNTYNTAPAINEYTYMVGNGKYTGWHWCVDDVEAILAIPNNRNAWHAGDGTYGSGNRHYIGVEIAYSTDYDDDGKWVAARANGAKLIAKLLYERGFTIANVRKHQDFSGKYCPHRLLDEGWEDFLSLVNHELALLVHPSPDFKFIDIEPGVYAIVSKLSGKALDTDVTTGNCVQWKPHFEKNQLWKITGTPEGYTLENLATEKVLDITGGSRDDGARAIVWNYTGGENQKFLFSSTGEIVCVNSGKPLDVTAASLDDGASIIQWASNGGDNQKWILGRMYVAE